MTRGEPPGLFGEPWSQHPENPKHVFNNRDEVVALAFTERTAARIVAAMNAVSRLPTEALDANVIDAASDSLMALFRGLAVDR